LEGRAIFEVVVVGRVLGWRRLVLEDEREFILMGCFG
jgi:hypothetical protein